MNKLFNKVAALSVGLAMAIGVGVAVGGAKKAVVAKAANKTYELVTSELSDWSGEYIIASGNTGTVKMLKGSTFSSDSAEGMDVTIANSKIVADESNALTIAKSTTSGKYTVKVNGKYIGKNANSNGIDSNATWSTNLNNTITYSSGKVAIAGNGGRVLTWYASNSNFKYYASSNNNSRLFKLVETKPVSSISVKTAPTKLSYIEGQTFDPTGLVINVVYEDTTNEDISYAEHAADFTFSPTTSTQLTSSVTEVTITYGGKSTAQAITVLEDTLLTVTVSGTMSTLTYRRDAEWNPAGLVVTGNYSTSGDVVVTELASFTFSPATPEAMGVGDDQTLSITATVSGISNETPYEQTVTVTDLPSEIVINKDNIANFTNSYAERDWSYGTGADAVSGKIKAFNSEGSIQMNHNNTCYAYNTTPINGYITSVTFTKTYGTTDLICWAGTSVLDSNPAEGGVTNTTYTWTFDPNDHFTYFRIATSGSDGARRASNIVIAFNKVATVDPTGIVLDDATDISMNTYGVGNRKLTATVQPFNANDKTVTWVSSDESVVTVDGGVLTPVGAGTAKVSARTSNYVSDEGTPNLFKSVNVTVSQADYRKVTFTPTSATTTQQSLDYLSGGSATISGSGTYDNTKQYIQFAQNKSGTFTINGYAGAKIVGIELFMCSNGNAGAGGLSVVAGATTLHTIESCSFDNIAWYGAFSANPVELYYDVTDYQMQANETITFAFNGTVNSLFVYGISLRYTVNTLEEWCQDFLDNYACNAAGTSAPSTAEWTKFNTKYGVLSAAEKTAAAEAEASESGTLLERAMAKYDYIVGKYNKAQHLTAYNDYIGRNPLPIGGTPRFGSTIFNETNAIIAIAVIASMIGIAFVGSYLLIKRRKEN